MSFARRIINFCGAHYYVNAPVHTGRGAGRNFSLAGLLSLLQLSCIACINTFKFVFHWVVRSEEVHENNSTGFLMTHEAPPSVVVVTEQTQSPTGNTGLILQSWIRLHFVDLIWFGEITQVFSERLTGTRPFHHTRWMLLQLLLVTNRGW